MDVRISVCIFLDMFACICVPCVCVYLSMFLCVCVCVFVILLFFVLSFHVQNVDLDRLVRLCVLYDLMCVVYS